MAVVYRKGVKKCQQWDLEVKIIGWNYKEFVKEYFPNTLELSINPDNKLILQDGYPVQKSKQAQIAYDDIGCKLFSNAARSPNMNLIKNVFNLVR